MPKITEAELQAIEAQVNATTTGPWKHMSSNGRSSGIAMVRTSRDSRAGRSIAVLPIVNDNRHADAEFIAAAPELVRYLVTQIRALQGTLRVETPAVAEMEAEFNTEKVNQ